MAAPRVAPGRVRRRLTVAFVLVAAMAAAVLAAGSYSTVRAAWFDASLAQATVDTRYQLVLAQQFLPLDEEHTSSLLTSFEGSGRHVVRRGIDLVVDVCRDHREGRSRHGDFSCHTRSVSGPRNNLAVA